jgi:hypothetical protein
VFTRSAAIAALATAHTAAAAKTRMVENVQRNHWQRTTWCKWEYFFFLPIFVLVSLSFKRVT